MVAEETILFIKVLRYRLIVSTLFLTLYILAAISTASTYNFLNWWIVDNEIVHNKEQVLVVYNASSFSLFTGLIRSKIKELGSQMIIVPAFLNNTPIILYGAETIDLENSSCNSINEDLTKLAVSSYLARSLGLHPGDVVTVRSMFSNSILSLKVNCILKSTEGPVAVVSLPLAIAARGQSGATIIVIKNGNTSLLSSYGLEVHDSKDILKRYIPNGWGLAVLLAGLLIILAFSSSLIVKLGQWTVSIEPFWRILEVTGVPASSVAKRLLLSSLIFLMPSSFLEFIILLLYPPYGVKEFILDPLAVGIVILTLASYLWGIAGEAHKRL